MKNVHSEGIGYLVSARKAGKFLNISGSTVIRGASSSKIDINFLRLKT